MVIHEVFPTIATVEESSPGTVKAVRVVNRLVAGVPGNP
jgi:hypothetical protein